MWLKSEQIVVSSAVSLPQIRQGGAPAGMRGDAINRLSGGAVTFAIASSGRAEFVAGVDGWSHS